MDKIIDNITFTNISKDFDISVEKQTDSEIVVRIKLAEEKVKLGDLKPGTVFKVGKREFIVLGHGKDTTAVILKDFLYTGIFDKYTNNYAKSVVRNNINGDFLKELEDAIGAKNVITHRVDLTANDGLKDYGSCVDKVSLITVDNFRRYREFLPGYGEWWFTATPYSTESNGYSRSVSFVSFNSALGLCGCNCSGGVRPFCILKSDLFVSLVED